MQTISIGKNRQRTGKLQNLQRATVSPCPLFPLEKEKCCKAPSSTRLYLLAWEETDRSRVSVTVLVDGLSLVASQTRAVCIPGAGGSS